MNDKNEIMETLIKKRVQDIYKYVMEKKTNVFKITSEKEFLNDEEKYIQLPALYSIYNAPKLEVFISKKSIIIREHSLNGYTEWEGYRGFKLHLSLSLPDDYFNNKLKKYLNRYEDWYISRIKHPEYIKLIEENSSIVTCKSVKDFNKPQKSIEYLDFTIEKVDHDIYTEYDIIASSKEVMLGEYYGNPNVVGGVSINLNRQSRIGFVHSLHSNIRRRGIGRKIIQEIIKIKEEENILKLTGDIAYSAIGFYEKLSDLDVKITSKEGANFKSFEIL